MLTKNTYLNKFLKIIACVQQVKLLFGYLNLSLIIRFTERYAMSISYFMSPKTVFKSFFFLINKDQDTVKNGNMISTTFC